MSDEDMELLYKFVRQRPRQRKSALLKLLAAEVVAAALLFVGPLWVLS